MDDLLAEQLVVEPRTTRIEAAEMQNFPLETNHPRLSSGAMLETERQYCLFMDGGKYNRNIGCKRHDNAYGINGGGTEADRRAADSRLYRHMRAEADPLAPVAWAFIRLYGWFFFNYHGRPWRGQLNRKIFS